MALSPFLQNTDDIDKAGAAASMLPRLCQWLRGQCKKIIADECQWHAAPLLDLAPAELIHQWKCVQRLISVLISIMRSLYRRPNPLSAISPHALSLAGLVSQIVKANKLVMHDVKSSNITCNV